MPDDFAALAKHAHEIAATRDDPLIEELADALDKLLLVSPDLEIVGSWLVQRGAFPAEYPLEGYGPLPYSDASPIIDLATISGWNPAPEGMQPEYRCTGPDGQTPRPLPTEEDARRHAQMGCGQIQKRHVTPWQKENLTDG